jgi:hypothetical protein
MPRIVKWLRKEIEKFVKWLKEIAVELVVWVIGWLVCVSFVAGGFGIGRWAAPHLGWDGNPDTFGLLSAITLVWIYEHRNAEEKYNRLRDLLDRR